jgi:hypothetical protein
MQQSQLNMQLRMHEKELEVREKIGEQVASALGDLVKSFTSFTLELMRNR